MTRDKSRSTEPNHFGRSKTRRAAALLAVIALCIVVGIFRTTGRPDVDRLVTLADDSLRKGDAETALEFAERALKHEPDSGQALIIAGRASKALGRTRQSIDFYRRIPDGGSSDAVEARIECGDALLTEFRNLSSAEDHYLRALEQDADRLRPHVGLAFLYGATGRRDRSVDHELALMRLGRIESERLFRIAIGGATTGPPRSVNRQSLQDEGDAPVLVSLALEAYARGDEVETKQLLRRAVSIDPESDAAWLMLGKVLLDTGDLRELPTWHRGLPHKASDQAVAWWIRGEWASRTEQARAAIRCYWESVRRDPNRQDALYSLGTTLAALGKLDAAEVFLERSRLLSEYVKRAELAYRVGERQDYRRAAELAEQLGLTWEAYGWAAAWVTETGGENQLNDDASQRLATRVRGLPLVRLDPSFRFEADLVYDEYPLPRWSNLPGEDGDSGTSSAAHVSFRNDARSSGLMFQYRNGGDPENHGIVHMYEVVGGGVAVLDYDHDGWPDAYFAQGRVDPPGNPAPLEALSDQLFRNSGQASFRDVTRPSRVQEPRFSQGATAGDFDGDGFTDIYVANIGPNRLYRNNGDGTFSDVSHDAGFDRHGYTASCLMVDLNHDALPDLYDVNYLAGDDLMTRVCGEPDRAPRSCLPQSFAGDPDRVHRNLGNGRYRDCTDECGVGTADVGKGLGIIAADLDGSGRLSLYISNDVGPNQLFVNTTTTPADALQFSEQALLRGAALNRNGNYESGMGIAAGDVDRDGRLDLFVTNFDDETNTLYRQHLDGMFHDETRTAGLAPKALPHVGWGAQFLDAELDGWPDLIVTNGHVNDLRDHGKPYRAPAQFFSNLGRGQFVERSADTLGGFFLRRNLGRGMARIDWNRDHLEDVLISHLDAPASLLTNTTAQTGHSFVCRLVGTRSARDPVGASVTIHAGEFTATRQLVAGDGNQSSNQRLLVFGLGPQDAIDSIEVRWPSGDVDRFAGASTGVDYLLIEGRATPFPLP